MESQQFEMSKETSDLINFLEKAAVGQVITYEELGEVVFGDVRGRCRANLITARNTLQREKRILFGTVRKVGIQRASDEEAVLSAEKGYGAIRRVSRRTVNRAACVQDFAALTPEMKNRHNATMSVMGAIAVAVTPSKVKLVQAAVNEASDRLAIGQTLELFKK